MVTHTAVLPNEPDTLSPWLAKAAPQPDTAADLWRLNPALPRRLLCGIVFDVVLCSQALAEAAYRILAQYEQPLGPALVLPSLGAAAVFVPPGTDARWPELITASQWPEQTPHPACLGQGHAIRIPALASGGAATATRWLQLPEVPDGFPPHLTSPVPLARYGSRTSCGEL
jgi:hypothetical protein